MNHINTVTANGSGSHRLPRRVLLAAGLGAALGTHSCLGQRKKSPTEKTPSELITPKAQHAIDRGLSFLQRRQNVTRTLKGAFGPSGYPAGTAVCSLAGLAFMCAGSAPGQGPYGTNLEHCVEFLLKNTRSTGFIATPAGHDNMYGHGFSMLFLAEAYGMTGHEEIGEKLRKAVAMTCECQNDEGGWRYQPIAKDADISITICQIMALRAALDAGIHVSNEVREKCIAYVKKNQTADGSFQYLSRGGRRTFALTAAGLVSLYSAGIYDSPEVKKGLANLMQSLPEPGKSTPSTRNYYYAHYYAVQATWHAGGEYWEKWYPAIRKELLEKQSGDGTWPDTRVGREYATAMCCIILQMPNNFVPAFSA